MQDILGILEMCARQDSDNQNVPSSDKTTMMQYLQ